MSRENLNRQTDRQTDRQTGRNYGIDLLRIVCMIMVPGLHILNRGGVMGRTEFLSANYVAGWLLEAILFCATDCFALITGYVCVGRKARYSNIFNLTFQVLFYTVVSTVLFLIFRPEMVGMKDIVKAVFPFAYGEYWYFSAYFGMFFFIPVFNLLLERLSKENARKLIFWLLIIFSALPTFFYYDSFATELGYSALWLSVLYFLGAYIKLYSAERIEGKEYTLFFAAIILTWLSRIGIEVLTNRILGHPVAGNYLYQYTSPTIVLAATCMLSFFSKVRVKDRWIKVVEFLAPLTFGSYLLQEEPLVRGAFIADRFVGLADLNFLMMVLAVIGFSVLIWAIGSMIDYIRIGCFKMLKIGKFCKWMESKIPTALKF